MVMLLSKYLKLSISPKISKIYTNFSEVEIIQRITADKKLEKYEKLKV